MVRAGKGCAAIALFLLCAPITRAIAADPEAKAGGVPLVLPAPPGDLVEVGDKLRSMFFELLTPSSNRLLTAYAPPSKIEIIGKTKDPGLDWYGMVEVLRQAEYNDITPDAFEQVVKAMDSSLGKVAAEKTGDAMEEINVRLKQLGGNPIEAGHPDMLGGFFREADAAGYGMLTAYKQEEKTFTMAGGMAVVRVKQRLILAYIFRKYESPETVALVRKDLGSWVGSILAKNK
jgi:hypothetical protein